MAAPASIAPTLEEIRAAHELLLPHIVRTPLIRFNGPGGSKQIFLKLENLQPIGSFKVRPMGNAMLTVDRRKLRDGVYTASSGNSGLGVAWMAAKLGVAARVYVPESAPAGKLQAIAVAGASVHELSEDAWWDVIRRRGHPDESGFFVDAVRDTAAMAGNGTIGLEIFKDLPEVDTVVVPFGGGGVVCGIASLIRALKPDTRIIVAECDAAAALTGAFRAGRPVRVPHRQTFISGAGASIVLDEMWPLASGLVDATSVVSEDEVADAIGQLFASNRIVAEGAGALSVAAAISDAGITGTIVCVVTGGNIDPVLFCKLLHRLQVNGA
ncbi:MAG TPA: pyridoxal-phosphate dependent enzyme [Woeseiaceae bacterium]|nr:pyridoxal-phosphate dependent enzyme [Woeseiaceae bacterium]